MNTDESTIATPEESGGNLAINEKQLGNEAYKLLRRYEKLIDKHDKVLGEIHQCILEFGRKLQAGRDQYYSDYDFGMWIARRHLNTGKMGERQQERSACMTIARLHDIGVEVDDTVPSTLDLTDCKRTRPTDIINWVKKTQPWLFPHLPRPQTVTSNRRPALEPDEVPNLGGDEGPTTLEQCISRALSSMEDVNRMDPRRKVALLALIERLVHVARQKLAED